MCFLLITDMTFCTILQEHKKHRQTPFFAMSHVSLDFCLKQTVVDAFSWRQKIFFTPDRKIISAKSKWRSVKFKSGKIHQKGTPLNCPGQLCDFREFTRAIDNKSEDDNKR